MNKNTKSIALIVMLLLLTVVGCKSKPKVMPANDSSAALLIKINLVPKIAMFTKQAEHVIFARVNGNNIQSDQLVISNYNSDGRVYILNAEPGEYVAVATLYKNPQQTAPLKIDSMSALQKSLDRSGHGNILKNKIITYLSEDLIRSTKTVVEPGKLNIAGEFSAKHDSEVIKNAKPVQKFYASKIAPKSLDQVSLSVYIGNKQDEKRDAATIDALKKGAVEDFTETNWIRLVK